MKKTTQAYLPQELLFEIFKRLPLKSLLRIRSVSKSWRSLISNPRFITLHRDYNNNNTHMLVSYYPSELCALHYDNPAFELHSEAEFPFNKPFRFYRIVGSCNGLICVGYSCVSYANDLFLWNPSIRKIVTLPKPGIPFESHRALMLVLGFGFDPKSNDYKVVRIVYFHGRNGLHKLLPMVELYTLSTGTWRGISAVVPPYVISNFLLQANVNGSVHWIAHNPAKIGGFRSLIVAFDLNDEAFKEMTLPNELAQEYPVAMSIAACGESLSLFHYYQSSSSNRGCSVWVMEKYGIDHSWTKLFNIELLQGVDLVLGSRKNGEFLVVTKDEKLVSYDPDDEQFKDLGICRTCSFVLRACSLYVTPYIESLILVDSSYGGLGNDSAPGLLGEDDSEIKDRQ